MANKTKYNKTLIKEILSELAVGKSIRSCLSPINKGIDRPCWETFRSWMRKDPSLRQQYEDAKTDGIEYLLSEDQGRYIIEINKKNFKKVADILNKNAVHFDELGTINENELYINDKTKVTIDELSTSNKSWLTNYMSK